MLFEERVLVFRAQLAVVGHALVVTVSHEVEDVFFEVRAGATDDVDFLLPDHLRERSSELGGAHRAGEGHHHLATGVEQLFIGARRVDQRRRVEVAEVLLEVPRDGSFVGRHRSRLRYRATAAQLKRYKRRAPTLASHSLPRSPAGETSLRSKPMMARPLERTCSTR